MSNDLSVLHVAIAITITKPGPSASLSATVAVWRAVWALRRVEEYRRANDGLCLQVREIALDMMTDTVEYGDNGLRWQTSAILALQEATEAFLVHMFEDA